MRHEDGISDVVWIITGVVLAAFILVMWVATVSALV